MPALPMKTSLAHLPEKKQQQLRALAELIRAEAEGDMVILFGSCAHGDWVERVCRGRTAAMRYGRRGPCNGSRWCGGGVIGKRDG